MFRSAELGHKVSRSEFSTLEDEFKLKLVQAQVRAKDEGVPLVILVNGVDGGGKGDLVQRFMEWMDPRHIDVHTMERPSDTEEERPFYYRFWKRLPAKGKTAIFLGNWYTPTILHRVKGDEKNRAFRERLDDIVAFERLLADEGVLLFKVWLHLSKKVQGKRLKKLSKDPAQAWRVTKSEWAHHKLYDTFYEISEEALRVTSLSHAPWHVLEATDPRFRDIEASRRLLATLEQRFAEKVPKVEVEAPGAPATRTVLDALDLSQALPREEYRLRMSKARTRLEQAGRRLYEKRKSAILVFEGVDAAGKGGAIKRIVRPMHPKVYRVVPVAAPTSTELARPYLWRFWTKIPRSGKVTIFDRSWYGRVLVERVEGFCGPSDWRRAYSEIRDFETQLVQGGVPVLKFWAHISQDEQLARFEARQATPHKAHKITEEDWRNRTKWPAYEAAISEMIDRTDTPEAPWILVEAEDKLFARVKIAEAVADFLEAL